MLGSIRTYFFEREKKKRLSEGSERKIYFKKDHPNHYGLLIDATQVDHRQVVTNFAEELRKKGNRVKILGFLDKKNESISVPFDIFTPADLSKVSKVPRSPAIDSFIKQPFDVLINMSIHQDYKSLEYISTLSHAAFRIGPWFQQVKHNPYDLCLDAGEAATLPEWIRELMHTLEKIY